MAGNNTPDLKLYADATEREQAHISPEIAVRVGFLEIAECAREDFSNRFRQALQSPGGAIDSLNKLRQESSPEYNFCLYELVYKLGANRVEQAVTGQTSDADMRAANIRYFNSIPGGAELISNIYTLGLSNAVSQELQSVANKFPNGFASNTTDYNGFNQYMEGMTSAQVEHILRENPNLSRILRVVAALKGSALAAFGTASDTTFAAGLFAFSRTNFIPRPEAGIYNKNNLKSMLSIYMAIQSPRTSPM